MRNAPIIGWTPGILTLVDAAVLPFTPWPFLLLENVLLLVGAHRAGTRVPVGGRLS